MASWPGSPEPNLSVKVSALTPALRPEAPELGRDDAANRMRPLLAQARAEGSATVTLLVAADPRAANAVAAALQSLGGRIRFRDDQLGYVRVLMPTSQVEAAAALNGVDAIDLDELIPLDDPRPQVEDAVQVDPPRARG